MGWQPGAYANHQYLLEKGQNMSGLLGIDARLERGKSDHQRQRVSVRRIFVPSLGSLWRNQMVWTATERYRRYPVGSGIGSTIGDFFLHRFKYGLDVILTSDQELIGAFDFHYIGRWLHSYVRLKRILGGLNIQSATFGFGGSMDWGRSHDN